MKMLTAFKLAIAVTGMTALGGLWLAPAADAAKIKDCGTIVVPDPPPPNSNAGFTETQTETQIAACHSSSDTGEVIETGPVTNKGGGTPKGQQ